MKILDRFVETAQEAFGINLGDGEIQRQSSYIEVPCLLSKEQLVYSQDNRDNLAPTLTNPFVFLTGIRKSSATVYSGQRSAKDPSISIVAGQYGLGKSELLHQLCYYILNTRNEFSILSPLPINLAFCRKHLNVLDSSPSKEYFVKLLFGNILERLERFFANDSFIYDKLLPQINNGNIFLILDGLDELIDTPNRHRNFFGGLIKLLDNDEGNKQFKIVVSARLEYLTAIDHLEKSDLVKEVHDDYKHKPPISVYFLRLELFDDQRIKNYLIVTTGEKSLFDKIQNNSKLLDILRRPLLLRIFCDLFNDLKKEEAPEKLDKQLKIQHVGELFEKYIDRASKSMCQDEIQQLLSPSIRWNVDKLALTSLKLFKEGREELEAKDICDFLEEEPGGQEHDLKTEASLSIHKIPFLRQVIESDSESKDKKQTTRFRFSHKAFYEFLTAKGMKLELEKSESQPVTTEGHVDFISFDKLVLNVDMRKFLKYLVGDEKWYSRTKRSYGLENPEQWSGDHDFGLLEENRKILLNLMTEPENATLSSKGKKTIDWFLKLHNTHELHPCYLMYNYEAVAVYLRQNWWQEEVRYTANGFQDILKNCLENILRELEKQEEYITLRDNLELLVERILSIGQRLRFQWVQDYLEPNKNMQLKNSINDEKTRLRIETILEQVKLAVF